MLHCFSLHPTESAGWVPIVQAHKSQTIPHLNDWGFLAGVGYVPSLVGYLPKAVVQPEVETTVHLISLIARLGALCRRYTRTASFIPP